MLTRNLPLKGAALALAVFLWFWVMLKEQNLVPQQTVRTPIAVEGVKANLVLATRLQEAEVRVRGLKEGVGDAARSVEAYVSCKGTEAGKHRLPVQVRAPADVTVVSVQPSAVTVELEETVSEARPVDLRLVGEPLAGYQLTGAEVSPKVVQVSGPRRSVERATRALVTVDLGRVMPEAALSLPVLASDSSGRAADVVEVTPARVSVVASLEVVVSSRTVPVVVRTRGSLAEGLRVASVQVEPAMVTFVGPANRVQEVEKVDTEELVLSGVRGSFERMLPLIAPREVKLLSASSVKVTVRVARGAA